MADKNKPKQFGGGKKGGTRFPNLGLVKAHEYCTKLVSKTHTGAQSENVILAGVFGSSTSPGKIRASALKQYGMLAGNTAGYFASDLAKEIVAAPENERAPLLAKAFLTAKIFKLLFDTFKGDSVSFARIRQKAITDEVHPDLADKCVTFFIEGVITSKLGTASEDGVTIKSASEIPEAKDSEADELPAADDTHDKGLADKDATELDANSTKDQSAFKHGAPSILNPALRQSLPMNIDLRLDASMDAEKLEKIMQVLRKYGAV